MTACGQVWSDPVARARLPGFGLRSKVVAWLRVLLPLTALGLLATLFMWSGRPDPESVIPYVDGDGSRLSGPPQITAPNWVGTTTDGAQVSLAAATATPRAAEGGQAADMRLDWVGPGGTEAMATAPQAAIDTDAIALSGGVMVELSTGWKLEADRVTAARDRSEVLASGGVAITAPFGDITADEARLHHSDSDETAGEVLDFTGGVRLLYQP